ncbi:MAG: hypothetical protein HY717_01690 [Planctomycetes bacterium]|nr:hypothetical protein [Planctomycetota bacterium]
MIKTTLVLPKDFWKEVKIRAVEEELGIARFIMKALEEYLRAKPKPAARKGAEK